MIERLEVTAGGGTVIRFGGIVAWADSAASPALISFLVQSARNLGPSPRGGRQIADHIAGVLASRDPEPHVGFAVIGPSDHGWATLLHGPAQAWDGAKWLAPARNPGWVQAIITARPTVTVGSAGSPVPPVQPDSMLDLAAGVVPGCGFLLVPALRPARVSAVGGSVGGGEGPAAGEERPPQEGSVAATEMLAVAGVEAVQQEAPPAAAQGDSGALAAEATTVLGVVGRPAAHPDAGEDSEPTRLQPRAEGLDEPRTVEMGAIDDVGDAAGAGAGAGAGVAAAARSGSTVDGGEAPKPFIRRGRRRPDRPGPPGSIDLESVSVHPRPPLPHWGQPDRPTSGGPSVAGVLCSRGHLNRPGLRSCVRCGTPIDEVTAERTTGTRPPLGVIVADDGAIYQVDQGYLIGSDPGRDPTVGGGLARPLPLAGADVSSTHAEIRTQDWDAVVVDRGSTAGTSVFELGATGWERCRPFEPRVISPGTHVAFGQRVVTFLGPWRSVAPGRPGPAG